jgi:DNA-binding response OmpR family regulator
MSEKVLIVENDEDIRDIVGVILENEGYEVAGCAYTLENLLIMTADLILLDEWSTRKKARCFAKRSKWLKSWRRSRSLFFLRPWKSPR